MFKGLLVGDTMAIQRHQVTWDKLALQRSIQRRASRPLPRLLGLPRRSAGATDADADRRRKLG